MSDAYTIMVIDDERLPHELLGGIVLLYKNSKDGLAALKEFQSSGVKLNELWLDHDLGYDETARHGWDTILPVVYWLEKLGHEGTPFDVGHIFIHTSNASAAPAMMDALKPYYNVTRASLPTH